MELTLEALSYVRHDAVILNNVTVKVPARGFTCLLGTNGAGKTTLLRILAGELKATSGKYYIGGTDASTLSRRERARYFAIIPQNIPIPPYLTVAEIAGLGRFRPNRALWWHLNGNDRARVDACLDRCQVTHLRNRQMHELSGGEQKRAWLAFGLAPDKEFLMLDETLDGMDVFIKRAFFQLLKDITAEGKGVLFATHDLDLVAEYADRVIVLSGGRIVFDGLPDANLHALLSIAPEASGPENQRSG